MTKNSFVVELTFKLLLPKYKILEPGLHFNHICHFLELACITKLNIEIKFCVLQGTIQIQSLHRVSINTHIFCR